MNEKLDLFKKSMNGKNIAVIGIGISNTPLIKFLVNLGAHVTACDKKTKEQLENVYNDLEKLNVQFCLGENYLSNLNHEIIFKTPGMRYDVPELVKARKNGSIITSEMEVFLDLCPAQVIGVTGSDGKTTTTTLIYEILKHQGYTCWLGGNIGKPLLSEIGNIEDFHKVVLELSSFQLHTMKISPEIAVVTNVTPNHLDIHKSMQEYIDAKKNIFKFQTKHGKVILNYDNDITRNFANETNGGVTFFSRLNNLDKGIVINENSIGVKSEKGFEKIIEIEDITIPGVHNIENYMAAIGTVFKLVKRESIKKVANTFKGVEHRIEFVSEKNGVKFYNDSIGSSPTRTIAGLNSFNKKVILIAGGYDKKIPFDELGKVIVNKVKKLILIGQTKDKIENAVNKALDNNLLSIIKCETLKDAVNRAYKDCKSGDIIILSPACASFDMFKNFEERGNKFKDIIKGL